MIRSGSVSVLTDEPSCDEHSRALVGFVEALSPGQLKGESGCTVDGMGLHASAFECTGYLLEIIVVRAG
jgi:hypothetical protein